MSKRQREIPKKIPKIVGKPFTDIEWETDDICDEELAVQAEILETRALTQKQSSSGNSKNVEISSSRLREEVTCASQVGNINTFTNLLNTNIWNASEKKLYPESTLYASHQKLANNIGINDENRKLKEKIKELEDLKAISDVTLLSLQAENDHFKKQKESDEQRIQHNLAAIRNLETQLAFKEQEITSSQWQKSQHASVPKFVPTFLKPKTVVSRLDDNSDMRSKSAFPTTSSFSKCLNAETNKVLDLNNKTEESEHFVLNNKCRSMESLLMKSLVLSSRSSADGLQIPLLSLFNGQTSNSPSTNKSFNDVDKLSFEAAHLESAINQILIQVRGLTDDETFKSKKNSLLSTFDLKNDIGEVLLRFIEDRLELPADSTSSDQTKQSTDANSFSPSTWNQLLHILKCAIYCSPRLRNCLLFETYTSSKWWNPADQTTICKTNTYCSVLSTLFTFFKPATQLLMDEASYKNLVEGILNIFIALAINSKEADIVRFVPFFNCDMMKVCKSLLTNFDTFNSFIQFFVLACNSPDIIRVTCKEDVCLWVILAPAWTDAASNLSSHQLAQLDRNMYKLLSQCLTHDRLKLPFIIADDCHCPFDVSYSLVNCLYRQKKLYDLVGKINNLPDLQMGIEVLLHMSLRDSNADDHRGLAKTEYIAFLRWLHRIHKMQNLGNIVEALLDRFSIGNDEHSIS